MILLVHMFMSLYICLWRCIYVYAYMHEDMTHPGPFINLQVHIYKKLHAFVQLIPMV